MKSAKTDKGKRPVTVTAPTPASGPRRWNYWAGFIIAFLALYQVYSPALNGPFLLDDTSQPYMMPNIYALPLTNWINGVRPLLMFSYWLNFKASGNEVTFGYHFVNLLLHFFNGALIYLAIRKVLDWAQVESSRARVLSIFAAALFLFHPMQTESVSYVASRSEALSLFFVLAAYVVFLYRKNASVGVGTALAILILFGAAVLSKEHTAVLPALLLLTDYYWNPGFSFEGIRRNWKLYVPILAAAAVGVIFVFRVLSASKSAGFGMKDVTWYQYFYTQCLVIWDYVRMFLLPFGQNLDYDFPFSRTLFDHGAIFGLIGLIAVSVLAFIFRRRFPLASYGWFTFLLLLAPTSSFVPIRDPIGERRMYLPFIGLLFITVEFRAPLEDRQVYADYRAEAWLFWRKPRSVISAMRCGPARWISGKTRAPSRLINFARDFNLRMCTIRRSTAAKRLTNSKGRRSWRRPISTCCWIGRWPTIARESRRMPCQTAAGGIDE